MSKQYAIIGEYNPTTKVIDRGATAQGYVYKNPNAFYGKTNEVCYIAELDDEPFTYADFLGIADGNEELATRIFENVDWQSPHTEVNEIEMNEDEE